MKILGRLLALFLIMPIVELALLVQFDKWIGFWPTIGIIVFTGVLGSYLAKREGLLVWRQFNQRLGTGAMPDKEAVDGIIILCAGALLITPGVITDFLGFVGLFPATRAVVRRIIMKRVSRYVEEKTMTFTTGAFGGSAYTEAIITDSGTAPEGERSSSTLGT